MTNETESFGPAPTRPADPAELVLCAHVERLKNRDLESFDEIYRLTREEVARLLFLLSGPGADLEALVADAYVRLFEELKRLPAGSPVRPALLRVCARLALERRGFFERKAVRASHSDGGPAGDAAGKLHRALGRLPARVRVSFVLCEVLGLSTPQVQAATGLSRSTLLTYLRRARLQLTEALRSEESAETEVTP